MAAQKINWSIKTHLLQIQKIRIQLIKVDTNKILKNSKLLSTTYVTNR